MKQTNEESWSSVHGPPTAANKTHTMVMHHSACMVVV